MGRGKKELTRKVSVTMRIELDLRDRIEALVKAGEWPSVSSGCTVLTELGMIVTDHKDKIKEGSGGKLVQTLKKACETGEVLEWAESVPEEKIRNVIEALKLAAEARARHYQLTPRVSTSNLDIQSFNKEVERISQ